MEIAEARTGHELAYNRLSDQENQELRCDVCFSETSEGPHSAVQTCQNWDHTVCARCLEAHARQHILLRRDVSQIRCPCSREGSECDGLIDRRILEAAANAINDPVGGEHGNDGAGTDIMERYDRLQTIQRDQGRECPWCNHLILGRRGMGNLAVRVHCDRCNRVSCRVHGTAHNPDVLSCREYLAQQQNPDGAAEEVIRGQAIQCPGCTAWVHRIAGCNHMTCRCGVEFCYCCGADITRGWDEHFARGHGILGYRSCRLYGEPLARARRWLQVPAAMQCAAGVLAIGWVIVVVLPLAVIDIVNWVMAVLFLFPAILLDIVLGLAGCDWRGQASAASWSSALGRTPLLSMNFFGSNGLRMLLQLAGLPWLARSMPFARNLGPANVLAGGAEAGAGLHPAARLAWRVRSMGLLIAAVTLLANVGAWVGGLLDFGTGSAAETVEMGELNGPLGVDGSSQRQQQDLSFDDQMGMNSSELLSRVPASLDAQDWSWRSSSPYLVAWSAHSWADYIYSAAFSRAFSQLVVFSIASSAWHATIAAAVAIAGCCHRWRGEDANAWTGRAEGMLGFVPLFWVLLQVAWNWKAVGSITVSCTSWMVQTACMSLLRIPHIILTRVWWAILLAPTGASMVWWSLTSDWVFPLLMCGLIGLLWTCGALIRSCVRSARQAWNALPVGVAVLLAVNAAVFGRELAVSMHNMVPPGTLVFIGRILLQMANTLKWIGTQMRRRRLWRTLLRGELHMLKSFMLGPAVGCALALTSRIAMGLMMHALAGSYLPSGGALAGTVHAALQGGALQHEGVLAWGLGLVSAALADPFVLPAGLALGGLILT